MKTGFGNVPQHTVSLKLTETAGFPVIAVIAFGTRKWISVTVVISLALV